MPEAVSLLPYVRVVTYDLRKNAHGRVFADMTAAERFIAESGTKLFNLYRIERVNGTWRTDWVLKGGAA